jgi:diacylglycerol kinase family enzyme
VPADAAAQAEQLLAELRLEGRVRTLAGDVEAGLKEAVASGPDVLAVLAGDGTARAAAELCGPEGPVLVPLPGGTMNMLPRAIYGERPWRQALAEALQQGVPRAVGGGEVDGRLFLVAAILGAPALWAPAREAVREGKLRLAALRARRALSRAFTGRLRYSFDETARGKAEAVAFMCPLTSRAMDDDAQALEAAALDPVGAAEVFRLGAHALVGDWRNDSSVAVSKCRTARVWASAGIPALLDGESVRLDRAARVVYRPGVVRILTLPPEAA